MKQAANSSTSSSVPVVTESRGKAPKKVPAQLIGDRSLKELAALIDETMPEDDPTKCVGADAEKVAAYIHESFYSIIAQERNRPARVELSHLTFASTRTRSRISSRAFTGRARSMSRAG